mgnify:CR=1 FL=1|tara:strand:- start:845 stop:1354 length:510 start_codon:yes stop_codon:yes gene_type:complete
MAYKQPFDSERALEAIVYIVSKLTRNQRHSIAKILYFADKVHLNDYGCLMFGDRYVKMSYGPVPSEAYDMIKYETQTHAKHEDLALAFTANEGNVVKSLREPDASKISEAMRLCIDQAISEYGHLTFGELTRLSHDDAWTSAETNRAMSFDAIVATLPDGPALMAHLNG